MRTQTKEALLAYAKKLDLPLFERPDGSFSIEVNKVPIYSVIGDHYVQHKFESWNYKSRGEGQRFHSNRNIESVKRTLRRIRRQLEVTCQTS